MTPKLKGPPAGPDARLRQDLDDAQTIVTRLEAENVSAIQDEEEALERGDTGSIVSARVRASASLDALTRQREKVTRLEAEVAVIDAEEAAKAGKRRLVQLTKTATEGRTQYEHEIARAAATLDTVARQLLGLRAGYFAVVGRAHEEARALGVSLRPAGTFNHMQIREACEALLRELEAMGADVAHLTFTGYGHPPLGWDSRVVPAELGLGHVLEQIVDGLAHQRATAQFSAEQEEAAHVA